MAAEDLAGRGDSWRIAVDIGGTFTDLVLADTRGAVRVFKVPSVTSDPAQGVLDALDRAAAALSLSPCDLLRRCSLFVHGSTVATNTVLEGWGAKVGLLTTVGFRDSLEIRRGMRENPWDHRTPNPPVLVPRHLRLPVRGRIDRNGQELVPLSAEDIAAAAGTFASEQVESVAVCLLNAFTNPAHEHEAAETLARYWPGDWITVSSSIAPIVGEYERGSTAVMNAYVAPRTVGYLRRLNERLRAMGLPHSLLLIQNNGGAISVEQVAAKPVTLLLSGPAGGVGALRYYARAIGSDDLMSMEIGGTSCDVMLMSRGAVPITDQFQIAGYHLALPSVDIHTIGAGGGTVAGTDAAGMLFAGPRGAGAVPGPAAYGLGGTEPTVTDAQLVLGRLKPGPYADGSVTLDRDAAVRAIEEKIARPVGLDRDAAAAGIIRLVEQNLLHAVQRISIERGHDPRRFVLVACGGAGPMHGATVGRMLKCPKVYVPRLSGAFCALGMLNTDVRHDVLRVHLVRLDEAGVAELDPPFRDLETQARRALEADGFASDATRMERELDLRYLGQQWDVRVPFPEGSTTESIRAAFEAEHERLYGHHQPDGIVEITKLRVVGIGLLPPLQPPDGPLAEEAPEPRERRAVWLDPARGRREIPVYGGADLRPGHRLIGPLLIEEQTTTVFVGPEDRLTVDAADNFVIDLPGPES